MPGVHNTWRYTEATKESISLTHTVKVSKGWCLAELPAPVPWRDLVEGEVLCGDICIDAACGLRDDLIPKDERDFVEKRAIVATQAHPEHPRVLRVVLRIASE